MATGNEAIKLRQVNELYKDNRASKAPVIFSSSTGNPAVFVDGAADLPVESLNTSLPVVQSGSGDPSLENVRPFVPWNSMTVFRSGEDTSNPAEFDVTFPSPIYGCDVDVLHGKATVKYVRYDYTGSSFSTYGGTVGGMYYTKAVLVDAVKSGGLLLSDKYPTVTEAPSVGNTGIRIVDGTDLYIYNETFTSWTVASNALNANPVVVVYELAEPYEISFDPAVLTTLRGINIIWTSGNEDVEVEYRADTGLFLQHNTVKDVQVDGSSILNNGVASIPAASSSNLGVVRCSSTNSYGINIVNDTGTSGDIRIKAASSSGVKAGSHNYQPIVPGKQHESVFYGLAKLAGADMAQSSNAVGTFTDEALQAIQKLFGLTGLLGPYEDDITADRAYAIGETFVMDGKRYRATAAISQGGIITPGTNCELCPISLSDVQINGSSILNNGVADIPTAGLNRLGAVQTNPDYGVTVGGGNYPGRLQITQPTAQQIKEASSQYRPITPSLQYRATFYGLATAAGDTTQSQSDNAVGTYTQNAKTAIQTMLGIEADIPLIEEVSGSTPSITGLPNVRYVCGTVSTLSITPPASGSIVVRFTSGSTPTILTVPNTVKFPVWFDYTDLEADTTYEIIITDGVYGGVMSWAD